ncbi:MAG: hypothetical protein JO316_10580 [Abitibacteriaceae bacterium]|nr:hypothetical protein [Abditibacteriaceae bacterium]MBV9865788.1 hypothetical protein [Abditibacteriaceae bacterium]
MIFKRTLSRINAWFKPPGQKVSGLSALMALGLMGSSGMVAQAQTAPPQTAVEWYQQAKALYTAKDYTHALQAIQEAVNGEPRNPAYLAYASHICREAGHYAEGVRYAEQAIHYNRRVPWYYAALAFNAYCNQDLPLARSACRKVLDMNPEQVGKGNYESASYYLETLKDHHYKVTWNFKPLPAMLDAGYLRLPMPTDKLPYQQLAKYEIKGVKSSKVVQIGGNDFLLVQPEEPLGQTPIEYTLEVNVQVQTYRTLLAKYLGHELPHDPLPPDVLPYLKADTKTTLDGPEIQDVARGAKSDNPLETVINILWWLKQHITYVPDSFKDSEEAIERGYGDCGAFSTMFASLCRVDGIPARQVWGITKASTEFAPPGHLAGHMWAEFYLVGVGWVPVEPQRPSSIGFPGTGRIRCGHVSPEYAPYRSMVKAITKPFGTYTPAYEELALLPSPNGTAGSEATNKGEDNTPDAGAEALPTAGPATPNSNTAVPPQ